MDYGKLYLTELVADIKKLLPDAKVLLFGSRARNTPLKSSDIDLIVISEHFSDVAYIRRPQLILPIYKGFYHIDLLCYTPAEFAQKSKLKGVVSQAVIEGKYL